VTSPPQDSADLRSGPELNERLLALAPLIGEWSGEGVGVSPTTGAAFRFRQRLRFVHDGRPFLAYESRSWLVDTDGELIRSTERESGFWRPGAGADDVEVVLASNTGLALAFTGTAGTQRWDLASVSTVPTPTAIAVDGEKRLYALVQDNLVYVTELAPAGLEFAPHLNARLSRS
jgi:outer membrane protein assembly factor BamB